MLSYAAPGASSAILAFSDLQDVFGSFESLLNIPIGLHAQREPPVAVKFHHALICRPRRIFSYSSLFQRAFPGFFTLSIPPPASHAQLNQVHSRRLGEMRGPAPTEVQ